MHIYCISVHFIKDICIFMHCRMFHGMFHGELNGWSKPRFSPDGKKAALAPALCAGSARVQMAAPTLDGRGASSVREKVTLSVSFEICPIS